MSRARILDREAAAERVQSLAPIVFAAVYPLPLFRRMTGLSAWAMRQCRRNGLRVVKVGRRHFIRGTDWDLFLARQTDSQSNG